MAKHKKPFTDGDLFKEAMTVTAETVCSNFKNLEDIKAAFRAVPLGPATVTRRVELLSENVGQQVLKDLSLCEYFSLQFDESLDVMDTAQLVVFVRMAFQDFTTKEDFLTLLQLKERTRGEDIYNVFKSYVLEKNIPIHKLVAITTDGAPAMCGVHAGFIALCRNDPDFPDFMKYHCVIHQQALAGKVVDFSHVMHLDKLAAEFSRRFGELDVMEDIPAFVSNPFLAIDTEEVAAKFQKAFALPGGIGT